MHKLMVSHSIFGVLLALLALIGNETVSWCAEQAITLALPKDRQVVQRSLNGDGIIRIVGEIPADATRVEVQAVLDVNATRGTGIAWTPLPATAINGQKLDGTFTLLAGGWYRLEVRAMHDDQLLAAATVAHIGVGDVYVTAGQSNSANFCAVRRKAQDDRVVYFDGTNYLPAQDPIPGSFGGGGSTWPILGDLLARSMGMPICFRGATPDYTDVKNWLPGSKDYQNLVSTVQTFGPRGVRAILWHQGESDALAGTSAEDYAKRLGTTIESMRKEIGYPIDWFVAHAAFHCGTTREAELKVLAGQQLLWQRGIAFQGPSAEDMPGTKQFGTPSRWRHDGVHMNELTQQIMSERWFAAIWSRYLADSPLQTPQQ